MDLIDLVAVGVGGTLGTGFFVLCSMLSHAYAGPAAVYSWALSALAALLSGFAFAELSGRIPAAGSSYAYAYAAMGELPAVAVAGCLTLEYLVSAAAVSRSWGDKVADGMSQRWRPQSDSDSSPRIDGDEESAEDFSFSPAAFCIAAAVTILLLGGIKESKAVTNAFTFLKVALVALLTISGFALMRPENLSPFVPPEFGWGGVLSGATPAFFGYLGFDEVSGWIFVVVVVVVEAFCRRD